MSDPLLSLSFSPSFTHPLRQVLTLSRLAPNLIRSQGSPQTFVLSASTSRALDWQVHAITLGLYGAGDGIRGFGFASYSPKWGAAQLRLGFPLYSSSLSLLTSELFCNLGYKGGRWAGVGKMMKLCGLKPSRHTVALSTRGCLLSSRYCGCASSAVLASQAH